jgi:hypothetical protein
VRRLAVSQSSENHFADVKYEITRKLYHSTCTCNLVETLQGLIAGTGAGTGAGACCGGGTGWGMMKALGEL